jgi:hypothetical protein
MANHPDTIRYHESLLIKKKRVLTEGNDYQNNGGGTHRYYGRNGEGNIGTTPTLQKFGNFMVKSSKAVPTVHLNLNMQSCRYSSNDVGQSSPFAQANCKLSSV